MFKKFMEWIHTKIYIDTRERGIFIRKGEVYWCALGENVGDEENGKGENFRRPVLIFRKFNNNIFWGIPLSSKNKNSIYYTPITLKNFVRSAMLSQLRLFDTKRLSTKIGYISKSDIQRIEGEIIHLIKS